MDECNMAEWEWEWNKSLQLSYVIVAWCGMLYVCVVQRLVFPGV